MRYRISLDDRLEDPTFSAVWDAFLKLLTRDAFASKDQIMQEANAVGIKDRFPWPSLFAVLRARQPLVLILPLTKLIFYGPRAKARQGVTPNRYISKTHKAAFGFASVVQFVQLGELERCIVEVKYKQKEIMAAKALQHAREFRDAITRPDQLEYDPNAPPMLADEA